MEPLLSYLDFFERLKPCHQGNNLFLGLVKCRGYERILLESISLTEKHLSEGKRLCNDLMQVTIRGYAEGLLFPPPSPPLQCWLKKRFVNLKMDFLKFLIRLWFRKWMGLSIKFHLFHPGNRGIKEAVCFYKQIILRFYQLSWWYKLATVKSVKADISSVYPLDTYKHTYSPQVLHFLWGRANAEKKISFETCYSDHFT